MGSTDVPGWDQGRDFPHFTGKDGGAFRPEPGNHNDASKQTGRGVRGTVDVEAERVA